MGGKKKHEKRERNNSDDEPETAEQLAAKEEAKPEITEQKFEAVPAKKVSYCPICSFPFELCKYGKEAPECAAFLYKLAPTKVNKYHPEFKPEQLELLKPKKEEKEAGKEEEQKGAIKPKSSVRDKFIVIDTKNRGKKNFVTTVTGLNNFNIDAKQVSKTCSKKFAVSCSAIELGSVQLQGDNFEKMKEFLLAEYKQLKKKNIIDKEEFSQREAEEKAKRKEARKAEQGVIQEVPEEEEKVEVVEKDKNALRLEAMQKAEEEDDD